MPSPLHWLGWIRRRVRMEVQAERVRHSWEMKGVTIAPEAIIFQDVGAMLAIGSGSTIAPFSLLHLQNDPNRPDHQPCRLVIGKRTAINEFSNIRASGGEILIGDDCLIAQFVSIIATNHGTAASQPMRAQPWDLAKSSVRIGNDVWVGANAVILPGVTIGDGGVIGAGAVVSHDVPAFCIAAGVPARIIGRRD